MIKGLGRSGIVRSAFFLSSTLAACVFFLYQSEALHRPLARTKHIIAEALTKSVPLPDNRERQYDKSKVVIYVLGGSQGSLGRRLRAASALYTALGKVKISTLRTDGITHYDLTLGRNLTNSEWVIARLTSLGVKNDDIELVSLKMGFFGTLSEAKEISRLAVSRGYRRLILVSSEYHTMRAWMSFGKFFENRSVNLYVYPSQEQVGLFYLLVEYVKLEVYKHVLIPRIRRDVSTTR